MNFNRMHVFIMVLLMAFVPAFSQQGDMNRSFGGIQARLTRYYLKAMVQALQLDREQIRSITAELRDVQVRMPARNLELMRLTGQMRDALLEDKPDTAALTDILERIRKERKYIRDREETVEAAVNKHLTIEQQAKFLLFQVRFKKQVQKLLDRVR